MFARSNPRCELTPGDLGAVKLAGNVKIVRWKVPESSSLMPPAKPAAAEQPQVLKRSSSSTALVTAQIKRVI